MAVEVPDAPSLAEAPEGDVATTWRPLGYNIRPRRLQWIAREAVARFGGALPSDEQTLLSFKGLGRYTVGAIRSFAFRQRAAILDTNVARVLFRVFVAGGDPKAHATIRHLWALSEALVPCKHVFDFNQALMDFGATVCTARKPQCAECPMKTRARLSVHGDHNREGTTARSTRREGEPESAPGQSDCRRRRCHRTR